jgi:glycosyltransferase involved in cell wall biosynthesis
MLAESPTQVSTSMSEHGPGNHDGRSARPVIDATVILLGTQAGVGKGGISSIIGQHLQTVRRLLPGRDVQHLVTHRGNGWRGKVLPAIGCVPAVVRAARLARRRGDTFVVMAHPGSGFCLVRTAALATLCAMLGGKVAWFFHTPILEQYLERMFWRRFFAFIAIVSDALCFLTQHGRSTFVRAYPRAVSKASVIGNPLPSDTPAIDAAALRSSPADVGSTILCMSRLVAGKGVDKVIAAMPFLPDHRLWIAGEGDQETHLRAMVATLGLGERVAFLGWVTGSDKDRLWRDCGLFCLPSRCDSFGMSFVEAIVRGVPVVALDWAGVSEVVSTRWNVLVADDTPEDVAAGVRAVQAFGSEPDHRVLRRMDILERFADDRIEASYRDLLSRMCR